MARVYASPYDAPSVLTTGAPMAAKTPADPSRRNLLRLLAAAATLPLAHRTSAAPQPKTSSGRPCRIRAITAGVALENPADVAPIESAMDMLERARERFEGEGYEVQTTRIATNPLVAGMERAARDAALESLRALDRLVDARGVKLSIGPVLVADRVDASLPAWTTELIRSTRQLNCTVVVATPDNGARTQAADTAGRIMASIAAATPKGLGNFRFAAIANVPAGTPFFPAAFHEGAASLAVGLESAALVQHALKGADSAAAATTRVRRELNAALEPVEKMATAFAKEAHRRYLGIDPSPAPGQDRSIGAALEALTHERFGNASTLEACAAVTAALKAVDVQTCGYAGLMLPVLEDPLLAQRATEGRYGLSDLLLYSSVCGTGLDVVPVPGDTSPQVLARIIRDTAALAVKWQKALSVRLLVIPGKHAGQIASFDDPLLTACRVFSVA
jgi:uncharacterized protein (UPF0210 family)